MVPQMRSLMTSFKARVVLHLCLQLMLALLEYSSGQRAHDRKLLDPVTSIDIVEIDREHRQGAILIYGALLASLFTVTGLAHAIKPKRSLKAPVGFAVGSAIVTLLQQVAVGLFCASWTYFSGSVFNVAVALLDKWEVSRAEGIA